MDFSTTKLMFGPFVALIVFVTVLNALDNNIIDNREGQRPVFPLGTAKSSDMPLPENPPSVDAAQPPKIGPIGFDRNIEFHCIFYSNFTYTCKTNCVKDSETTKVFPENPLMKYTDFNCSTDVPTKGVQWSKSSGFIRKYIDESKASEILATCAFYHTNWYECYGVADCSRGEGLTMCAGAAPWRGYYDGSPEQGFSGNITAEAMNSPPMHPHPSISVNTQVAPAPARKLLYSCEKFVEVTDPSCYEFKKRNGTVSGRSSNTTIREHFIKKPNNEHIFLKFDEVLNSIGQNSLEPRWGVTLTCYFYDNREFMCSFPFAVELNDPSSLAPATGSYYSGAMPSLV